MPRASLDIRDSPFSINYYLNVDVTICWFHAQKRGLHQDISREKKKSVLLFLLKYYHTLNLFTREDLISRLQHIL
jgi:hypothetical protein